MKVSVLTVTYNHEPFIAQALDSILMQEVDFDYEIVVGEDCSTDQTRRIVREYQARHPDRIKPLLHERNVGARTNFLGALAACTGEYVAMLDGDDYWLTTDKLQRQVDFLDANPEYSFCFSNARIFRHGAFIDNEYPTPAITSDRVGLDDLIRHQNFVPSATLVFRNAWLSREYPAWFHKTRFLDFCLLVSLSQRGPGGRIPGVRSVYRMHAGGIAALVNRAENFRALVSFYKELLHDPGLRRYSSKIRSTMGLLYYRLSQQAYAEGQDRLPALGLWCKAVSCSAFGSQVRAKLFADALLQLVLPRRTYGFLMRSYSRNKDRLASQAPPPSPL